MAPLLFDAQWLVKVQNTQAFLCEQMPIRQLKRHFAQINEQ
jgi:hypothetical protein